MPLTTLDVPLDVDAIDGKVRIKHEAGVAFMMTAHAALETAERLHEEAVRAIGQEKFKEWKIGELPR
jgi:hypothetical protein